MTVRAVIMALALAVGLAPAARAQRGGFGGGGFGGMGGGRQFGGQMPLAPELPGPEMDGPPDSATATAMFGLKPPEAARYAVVRDSFMVATRPQRDSARDFRDQMNEKLDDGDREGATFFVERLQRVGKVLKDRQNKFEDELPKILTSDEMKDYKKWKKDLEQAAEDRRRQDAGRWMARGTRYGGGGAPGGFGGGGGGYDRPIDQKTAVETHLHADLGSSVIRVGREVYVSGQVALDSDGKIVGEGDLAAQARQAFGNLSAALGSARSGPSDVVRLTIYVVNYDPKDVETIRTAGSAYFAGRNAPVVTVVGVQALSQPGLLISVEASALSNIAR